MRVLFCGIFLSIFLLFVTSCTPKECHSDLLVAEDLLWRDLDSCQGVLDAISQDHLTTHERYVWQLCHLHAHLRATRECENDSLLQELMEAFKAADDCRHAGEACYLMGTVCLLQHDVHMAAHYLKEAELFLKACNPEPVQLLGLVYYRLGNAADEERMFFMANQYFEKSIPYLKQTDNYLYLHCAYRDAARTMDFPYDSSAMAMMDTAMTYVHLLDNPLQLAVAECDDLIIYGAGTDELLPHYHLLCDSFGQAYAAFDLVKYYTEQDDLPQVAHYLDILALDTLENVWSWENYHYYRAAYLERMGLQDSAVHVLQYLHNQQTSSIITHAYSRAALVTHYYDHAIEREQRLQLQIERQRLYLFILGLLLLMALLIGTWLFLHQRERNRIAEQQQQLAHMKALHVEKQQALIRLLHQRLLLSEQLVSSAKQQSDMEEMPERVRQMVDTLLFTNDAQARILRQEVNAAYGNILLLQKEAHPQLTDLDQTVCGLVLMGLTTKQICFLLSMSKETLYTRRKRIKSHLGLTAEDDLEAYLKAAVL